jgi:GxxExxY protein
MALVHHVTNAVSGKIICAAIEVHRHLGAGLLESVYHACLCRELHLRGVEYQSRVSLPIEYKGVRIAKGYVIDLLVEEAVVVELKSVDKLLPLHAAQLMTYLRIQSLTCGLLINFNVPLLHQGIRRILL